MLWPYQRYMWSFIESSSFAHCKEANRKQELKGKEELNKKKQEKASLNKEQKKCSKLDTKQSELDSDIAKTNEDVNIAKQML